MNKEEIRNAAEQLQLELLKLDPDTTENWPKIEKLQDGLQRLLEEPEFDDHEELQSDLSESVGAFEASHPKLNALMQQFMSLLESIGL